MSKLKEEKNIKETETRELITSRGQRRIIWFLLVLIALAVAFLFTIAQEFKMIKPLRGLAQDQILAVLDRGKLLQEEEVVVLGVDLTNAEKLSFTASADGRRFAYVLKNTDSQQVILNELAGPFFESISYLSFSPNSRNFAYLAKQGGGEVVVLNEQVSPVYDAILSPHTFSPDSRYYIFKAALGGKELLVVNGKESQLYDHIYEPFLTEEGDKLVFFALKGQGLWRGLIPLDSNDED